MANRIHKLFAIILTVLSIVYANPSQARTPRCTRIHNKRIKANKKSAIIKPASTQAVNTQPTSMLTHNQQQTNIPTKKKPVRFSKRLQKKEHTCTRDCTPRHYISNLFQDALELHKNLFTWDTLKIAATIFPVFVGTRMIDERLQSCFYNKEDHKNIYYLPKQCHDFAQWSISIPIIVLGSQAFFGKTEDMRETSRVFLLGLPFVFWTKTLVKKMQFEANMRPWNENFDCTKRSGGGFPSGHMAEATYTALLYGLKFGPRFAIPLGAVATFIGVSFVACNRHYISQIVAGAGLGAVYGLAAYKLANSKIKEDLKLGFKIHNGGPALSASYTF